MSISGAARPQAGAARSGTSVAVAVGLHLLALLFVPEFRATIRSLAPTSADFVEVEPEPPPPPPPPPEVAPPAPRVRAESAPSEPAPTEAPPPPIDQAEQALPELIETDITLGSPTFTMPATTGTPTGPIQSGSVTGMNTQGSAVGVPDGVPGGTGLARAEDLSVTAGPTSDMNSILQNHYPEMAEQQGVAGTASVSVEILADGSVGRVQPRGESIAGFGFGRACIAAVREARWSVARDRNGTPVASHVRFRCVFDVRR